jgi:lipopolysaccharide export system protein LptA
MKVKSRDLHAYLAESGADSRLEKAFADGAVEIVQVLPDKTRTGTAEHGEYYVNDQKVILNGGHPKMVDSVGGQMEGRELIYTASDGSLQGNGAAGDPIQSRIIRGHKK